MSEPRNDPDYKKYEYKEGSQCFRPLHQGKYNEQYHKGRATHTWRALLVVCDVRENNRFMLCMMCVKTIDLCCV